MKPSEIRKTQRLLGNPGGSEVETSLVLLEGKAFCEVTLKGNQYHFSMEHVPAGEVPPLVRSIAGQLQSAYWHGSDDKWQEVRQDFVEVNRLLTKLGLLRD